MSREEERLAAGLEWREGGLVCESVEGRGII